jgi:hypothetical protein
MTRNRGRTLRNAATDVSGLDQMDLDAGSIAALVSSMSQQLWTTLQHGTRLCYLLFLLVLLVFYIRLLFIPSKARIYGAYRTTSSIYISSDNYS